MALEKTTITHIFTTPGHPLELVTDQSEFVCFKCSETGTGIRYHCKKCDELSLHQGCAAPTIAHTLRLPAGKKQGLVCEQCAKIGTGFLHRGCGAAIIPPEEVETADGISVLKRKLEEERTNLEEEKKALQEERKKLEEEKALQDEQRKLESLIPRNAIKLCPVAASSTYPGYGIEGTLDSSRREWCNTTTGSWREWLIYTLPSAKCNLIDEFQLLCAYAYINANWTVCFKIGCSKSSVGTSDDNYTWIYTSPTFTVTQQNTSLQSFKLPFTVRCIGGAVKLELSSDGTVNSWCGIRQVIVLGRQFDPTV